MMTLNEMKTAWQPGLEVRYKQGALPSRRAFLRRASGVAVGGGMLALGNRISVASEAIRRRHKACILLWMQGGPSQFETWDPKAGHANGGETKAIATNVAGIRFAENLPHTSQVASKLCVIRSLTSKEGSHPRATHLMRTGYLPQASVKYPALGSQAAFHLRDESLELPPFVRIGRGNVLAKGGFLGVDYDPFAMASALSKPNNTDPGIDSDRFRSRLQLVNRLERRFEREGGEPLVKSHRKLYQQASRMILSRHMSAFDLEREPEKVRAAYGEGETAAALLMARRLVEVGVPFVEVNIGNWDTHDDNFNRTRTLCEQMDRPFATLLQDLEDRSMLEDTLVICAGEFGRTPRINARGGRDHFPRAYSAVLAGSGVRGGQVIGATDAGGTAIVDRPVRVPDFFHTVFRALGIDAEHEYVSNIGRPIKAADEGNVIDEVFSG